MRQMRSLWEEFAWGRFETLEAATSGSSEHESGIRGAVGDDWGKSESVDPDNVGDIADEGAGHRG
jgi:hypothetical protein